MKLHFPALKINGAEYKFNENLEFVEYLSDRFMDITFEVVPTLHRFSGRNLHQLPLPRLYLSKTLDYDTNQVQNFIGNGLIEFIYSVSYNAKANKNESTIYLNRIDLGSFYNPKSEANELYAHLRAVIETK